VKKPVHARNNSRVSCYSLSAFAFKNLETKARVSCYKTACLLLRFYVFLATEFARKPFPFSEIAHPPVVTCIDPCRNAPVVGEKLLWKNGGSAATTMRAALRLNRKSRIPNRSPPFGGR
jgi:hypothetical protein